MGRLCSWSDQRCGHRDRCDCRGRSQRGDQPGLARTLPEWAPSRGSPDAQDIGAGIDEVRVSTPVAICEPSPNSCHHLIGIGRLRLQGRERGDQVIFGSHGPSFHFRQLEPAGQPQ